MFVVPSLVIQIALGFDKIGICILNACVLSICGRKCVPGGLTYIVALNAKGKVSNTFLANPNAISES